MKKLLRHLLILLLFSSFINAKEDIDQIIKKTFSNPQTFHELQDYYNKNIGISKPKRVDEFTVVNENRIKNKTIYFTKELTVNKNNINDFYNKILKYFGPKSKINVIYPYLIKTYNYDTAEFLCGKFKNTDFFEYGGKIELKTIDDFQNKEYLITISSKKECEEIDKNYKLYMDTLQNMILQNRNKNP